MLDTGALQRLYFSFLAASLIFRFWFAANLPITGDEAYFIFWGRLPDWGFYDHPPMVGWWLAAVLKLGDAEWWLRLPQLLQPMILSISTFAFLRGRGYGYSEDTAWFAAILVLLAPANVWNVLITTDTPLVYFSFFSALAFIRAVRDDHRGWYFVAGFLLGGAFLSKYFAVLLGFAYVLYALWKPTRAKWTGLLLVILGAAWGPGLNIWWNMNHCWANIMFNVFNRHEGSHWSPATAPIYVLLILYVLTPLVVFRFARLRIAIAAMWQDASSRALLLIGIAPLALFAALSLAKNIGAHWVLSFVPFVLIAFARALPEARRMQLLRFFGLFALAHVVLFTAVLLVPVETFSKLRQYDGIVMTVKAPELLERLRPFADDYSYATDGYSPSVTMGYNARRYFLVFGPGSSHARHDDILTDFRELDGRNILILHKSPPKISTDYAPYFHEVEVKQFDLHGARFWLVLGRGFNYAAYRDAILEPIRRHWYAIPNWLPMTHCYFCERYFPERSCRAEPGNAQ